MKIIREVKEFKKKTTVATLARVTTSTVHYLMKMIANDYLNTLPNKDELTLVVYGGELSGTSTAHIMSKDRINTIANFYQDWGRSK